MSTRLVEYEYISSHGEVLERSSERLVYFWFSDEEVKREAFQAGLVVMEQCSSFSGGAGRESIYILRRVGSVSEASE